LAALPSFPTRRSSDLQSYRFVEIGERRPEFAELALRLAAGDQGGDIARLDLQCPVEIVNGASVVARAPGEQAAAPEIGNLVLRRSEEHTSELQSLAYL